jgi:LPS O-antigen subunit length determinant protein (WzzB/FepE family)
MTLNGKAEGTEGPERNGGREDRMKNGQVEVMDFVRVLWKRKWQIVVPTLICVLIAGILSFVLPKKWEVDTIFVIGKFFVETSQGEYKEVQVIDPRRVVGQVNEKAYNRVIASALNVNLDKFPRLMAENVRGTELVRVAVVERDVKRGQAVLDSLTEILRKDCDRKIDVELKIVDTQIASLQTAIKMRELDIQTMEIEKAKLLEEIASARKKVAISEKRSQDILAEMKAVEIRIKEIEPLKNKALEETKQAGEAMGVLLYANEIQANLRYHNTLADNLSGENVNRENLSLAMKVNDGEFKKITTAIDRLRRQIDDLNTEITRLTETKGRIDHLQIIKAPSPSFRPVFPNKVLMVTLALVLGLVAFTLTAVSVDFIQSKNFKNR